MTQRDKNIKIKRQMEKMYRENWNTIWQSRSKPILCEQFKGRGGKCVRCADAWCNVQTFKAVNFDIERIICYKCKKALSRKPRWPNKCTGCSRACERLQYINAKYLCDNCYLDEICPKN